MTMNLLQELHARQGQAYMSTRAFWQNDQLEYWRQMGLCYAYGQMVSGLIAGDLTREHILALRTRAERHADSGVPAIAADIRGMLEAYDWTLEHLTIPSE